MGRPLQPGAKQLTADQRRGFAELRLKLGLSANELVDLLKMKQSEFSNAVRENGKRSFRAEQWSALVATVDTHMRAWERNPERTTEEQDAARVLYKKVFGSEEVSAPVDVQPGDQMPPNTATYVERPVQGEMEEAIAGGLPLIWILGGPKTGKTSMIARAAEFCTRSGVKCYRVDLEAAVSQAASPMPGLSNESAASSLADIWSEIILALGDEKPWEADSHNSQALPSKFGHDLRELLSRRSKGGRKLLIIDHLDRIHDNREQERLMEAVVFNLALIRADSWTIVLSDEGIRTSSPLISPLVTRGTMISLGGFSRVDIGRLFERMGLSIASVNEDLLSDYFAAIGINPFLHHASAAHIRRTLAGAIQHPRRSQNLAVSGDDLLEARDWVLNALVEPDRHSTTDTLAHEIIRFRESVIRALHALAENAGADRGVLIEKLCSPKRGIGGNLGLPSRVDVGLHWSSLLPVGSAVPDSLQRIAKSALPEGAVTQRGRRARQ